MIYKKLKKYVPEKLGYAYLGIFLAFVAAVCSVLSYYYIYQFLSEIIVNKNIDAALTMSVRIVVLLIAGVLIYFASVMATHILAFRLETNLKKEGLKRIMNASFSFFDKNESGKVRKMIDDNTVLTHTSVAHLIPDLSSAIFVPALGMVLSFYVDYRLGILFLALIIIGAFIMAKMMGNQDFMKKYMAALDKMNAGAVEYVRGIHVLKIFKANVETLKDFYASVVDYSDLALKYSMSCRRWYVNFQILFNGAFLFVIFFYFMGMDIPEVFLVKFMFYVAFNGIIFIAFMKVMYVGMYVFQANNCIKTIEKVFDEMDENKLNTGTIDEMNVDVIEFKDVSFGYGENLVIENLSFKIEGGKQYALVGASGSGKSTIVKLISGFYKLNSGEIQIGGHSLEEYSEKAISNNISNIFQDARLFKKTIFENVKVGNMDASYEDVMEALHLAQCDEILDKFEDRENTLIGSKGVHLSGGEVQRISIARAILKNAKIVIMDEASAAADPENEYELQKALSNLMQDKTVIMIAHRLSSIRDVDEVLVIDEGKVIERGSHKDLMASDTRYKVLQEEYMRANEWRVK